MIKRLFKLLVAIPAAVILLVLSILVVLSMPIYYVFTDDCFHGFNTWYDAYWKLLDRIFETKL